MQLVAPILDSAAIDVTISIVVSGQPASESPRIWFRICILAKSPGNLCVLCNLINIAFEYIKVYIIDQQSPSSGMADLLK